MLFPYPAVLRLSRSCHLSRSKQIITSSPRYLSSPPVLKNSPRDYTSTITILTVTGAALIYLSSVWKEKRMLLNERESQSSKAPTLLGQKFQVGLNERIYVDPTTSTQFPVNLSSPSGEILTLVGTGVRTVSFLSIRVYAVGFYVNDEVFRAARAGDIEGWKDFTAERMTHINVKEISTSAEQLRGEILVANLLDKPHDAAVVIIPLRNTTLGHLRDGFSRALIARMNLPRVASKISPTEEENASDAVATLHTFFPARSLSKGSSLYVYRLAKEAALQFAMEEKKASNGIEILGTLKNDTVSRELFLSYFSDEGVISEELRSSVARGFAGEKR